MTNFDKVGTFMKTFGQEVKTKPSFSSDKINELILKVISKRKITAVTITHDIKSAIKTGDHYYFIDNGIIQDKGDCKKILKTKNQVFKSFITGADIKQ